MEQDRPLQAGDWAEHITSLVSYEVEHTSPFGMLYLRRPNGEILGPVSAAEFKRVDGPHPVGEAEQLCQSCEQPAGYCAENCAVRPRECSECHAPAKLDPDNGMCAYCCASTGHGDEGRAEQDRIMRHSTDYHHGHEARARNEAALRREAERPRGNPAERESLAAGHPASWPSNEGED